MLNTSTYDSEEYIPVTYPPSLIRNSTYYSIEDMAKFEVMVKRYEDALVTLFDQEEYIMTPYIHFNLCHLLHVLYINGPIGNFQNQAFEASHTTDEEHEDVCMLFR